jgi:hypothetical protein
LNSGGFFLAVVGEGEYVAGVIPALPAIPNGVLHLFSSENGAREREREGACVTRSVFLMEFDHFLLIHPSVEIIKFLKFLIITKLSFVYKYIYCLFFVF